MHYKAIGFDYGGVIGGIHTSGPSFSDQVCTLLDIDKTTYNKVFFSLCRTIHLGEVATWREFLQILLDKLGQPEKLAEVIAINDKEEQALQVVSSTMLDLVDALHQKGYRTGLLSNNTLESGRTMRANGLNSHFDVFHISAETKLMKPDPETYQKFAQDLGVNMHDLIFIDNSQNNLSTADHCGYTPILFTSPDRLREQLHNVGIVL